jgi:hypothetical protein
MEYLGDRDLYIRSELSITVTTETYLKKCYQIETFHHLIMYTHSSTTFDFVENYNAI